jgi:hypothetical protein
MDGTVYQEYLAPGIAVSLLPGRLASLFSLQGLANKHPDIRLNHVVPVLAMRGDLNRSLVQKVS